MASSLPIEIVEQILKNLANDEGSLTACALAGSLLRALVRPLLFRTMRLSSPSAPTRLLNLLTDIPDLISLVTSVEIHVDSTASDHLEPLLTLFCGAPDNDGRYHGAGPLRSVSLIRMNWNCLSSPIRRAMLALLSCSSVNTITLCANVAFHSTSFVYLSPNLYTLNLYSCLISLRHALPEDTLPSPLQTPLRRAQITSFNFMGSSTAPLLARSTPTFNLTHVDSIRVFIRPTCLWSNVSDMFKKTTAPSCPLHSLSLILAPFGKSFHQHHGYISPSESGWLGYDLSSSPFHTLRTLKIYAHSGAEALPVRYPLFFWIASTLEKLPQEKCHLETLLVYIMISEESKLDSIGPAEDWAKLAKALKRIELPKVCFLIQLEFRNDRVQAMFNQFERLVNKRLVPTLPNTQITTSQSDIIWPPEDIYPNEVWLKPFSAS